VSSIHTERKPHESCLYRTGTLLIKERILAQSQRSTAGSEGHRYPRVPIRIVLPYR